MVYNNNNHDNHNPFRGDAIMHTLRTVAEIVALAGLALTVFAYGGQHYGALWAILLGQVGIWLGLALIIIGLAGLITAQGALDIKNMILHHH